MTLDEMTEQVITIVQDDSFSDSIPAFINQAILEVGRLKLSSLDSTATVTCTSTDDSVALPEDYLHGLYSVHNGEEYIGTPAYYDYYSRFLRYHPERGEVGKITDVAVKGNRLHYVQRQDIDLTLCYFRRPDYLYLSDDEPDFLPGFLHKPLLVNHAASAIFNLIEDGIEYSKTNTRVYLALYQEGLAMLQPFILDTEQPIYIQDEWRP